jgi:alpha-galactosidase
MQTQIHQANLSFATIDITLQAASPMVRLLVGPDEQLLELVASASMQLRRYERNTPYGPVDEHEFTWQDQHGYRVRWSVGVLRQFAGLTLSGAIYNGTGSPVRLHEFTLCHSKPGALRCTGDPADWWLSTLAHTQRLGHLGEQLPSSNDLEEAIWAGYGLPLPTPLPSDDLHTDGRWRSYEEFLTLYCDGGRRGMAIGPVGAPEADLRYDCFVEHGVMALDIVCELNDVLLAPGEWRNAQQTLLLCEPYELAMATLLGWLAISHGQRRQRAPLVGWCSWYDLAAGVSAASVLATTRALAELREHVPLQTIQIDDGYQRQVGDWGWNEKFPDGAGPLIEAIRMSGAAPGIWLAPLAVHDSLGWLDSRATWFQRNAQGELAGSAGNWGPTSHWLDPSHPAVQHELRAIIRQKRAEGFSYFKIDFNTIERTARLYNPTKTRLQAFRDLYRLYREEVGEEAYLLACMPFGRAVMGYADASRIGPDSLAIWQAAHPCTILESIRAVGMNAVANRVAFSNDPDVTYLRPRGRRAAQLHSQAEELSEAEWQTWHSFVGTLGGAVFISDPLELAAYAESARALAILTPPAPETARPWRPGSEREPTQFGFIAERAWGDFAVMLLWNPDDAPGDLALDTRGLERFGDSFHIWSFWDERYLGCGSQAFTAQAVAPHGPALLRLTPATLADQQPCLVGSTLHIGMGAAEIGSIRATSQHWELELTAAGALDGAIYLHCTQLLKLHSAEGCTVAKIEQVAEHIWRVGIEKRQRATPQRVVLDVKEH